MKISKKAVMEATQLLHRMGFIEWKKEGDVLKGTATFDVTKRAEVIGLSVKDVSDEIPADVFLGKVPKELREKFHTEVYPEPRASAAGAD